MLGSGGRIETDCQNWWFQNRSPKRGLLMLLRFPVVDDSEERGDGWRGREAQGRKQSKKNADRCPRCLSLRMRLLLPMPLPLPSRDAIVTSRSWSQVDDEAGTTYRERLLGAMINGGKQTYLGSRLRYRRIVKPPTCLPYSLLLGNRVDSR